MSEVEEELELADQALSDLDHMENISLRRRYTTLYFAVYHSARAVLLRNDYAPKTHSGLDTLIHSILHKDLGVLDSKETATFSKLKTRREQADHETEFLGTEEELEKLEPEARQLVEKLRKAIE